MEEALSSKQKGASIDQIDEYLSSFEAENKSDFPSLHLKVEKVTLNPLSKTSNKMFRSKSEKRSLNFPASKVNEIETARSTRILFKSGFEGSKTISALFEHLQKANECFEEVISTVSCYRIELGMNLEKIYSSYSNIFKSLIQTLKKELHNKDRQYNALNEKFNITIQQENTVKEDLMAKIRGQQNVIKAYKSKLRVATMTEESLNQEVKKLREILRMDLESTQNLKKALENPYADINAEKDSETEGKVYEVGPKYRFEIRKMIDSPTLRLNLEELQITMDKIESEAKNKKSLLEDMGGVLRQMVRASACDDKGVQVGEGLLYWDWYPIPIMDPCIYPTSFHNLLNNYENTLVSRTKHRITDTAKWKLTPVILKFLANNPERLAPAYDLKDLKKLISEICAERLLANPEACVFSHQQLKLDEFLCIFFMKRYKHRRIAEIKLKSFLATLRAHIEKSTSARMFCTISGITGDILDNNDYLMNDYYTQLFYVYCMNRILRSKDFCIEDEEARTWLKSAKEEEITAEVLSFISKADFRKVRNDIRIYTIKIAQKEGDIAEVIDIDTLLNYYVTTYIGARQANLDKLTKNFNRRNGVQIGLYSYDEFKDMVKDLVIKDKYGCHIFPSEYTLSRAFYCAFSLGKNYYELTLHCFLAGCIRLGIDNPFPFAQYSPELVYPARCEHSQGMQTRELQSFKSKKQTPLTPLKMPRIDRVAGLLGQHFSIIREIKNHSNQLQDLLEAGADTSLLIPAFERLCIILSNAYDFFAFPVIF